MKENLEAEISDQAIEWKNIWFHWMSKKNIGYLELKKLGDLIIKIDTFYLLLISQIHNQESLNSSPEWAIILLTYSFSRASRYPQYS